MAKNLNFFEYTDMLENEYKDFSPSKLLTLGTRIAELEFDKHSQHFYTRKFDKYALLLKDALEMLKKVANDRSSVPGPAIDQQQKNATYAANKLRNKLDISDKKDAGLISILQTINSTISYLKSEDSLYMISVWRAPAMYNIEKNAKDISLPSQYKYYKLFKAEFKDQIDLLWKLKRRLGI
ncbi:hypothetical protein DBR11_20960 [Pedobacter sp. HMWF019]|uniref:hypothetical protein n=1 Tax=Pedobacter sp. HMWF019 TaxID=2056856 RepID=UPI000D347E16|nr:hypothetical protein [Pedobacter sp. HMWF019]PTS95651.1 hypothetical protein DBR11_20960 [Pedobacter sp. HMWF019]